MCNRNCESGNVTDGGITLRRNAVFSTVANVRILVVDYCGRFQLEKNRELLLKYQIRFDPTRNITQLNSRAKMCIGFVCVR